MQVEDFIQKAGEDEVRPDDPVGGIPIQKLPWWFRFGVRVIILPFLWLDVGAQKFAKLVVPPPYKKSGHCLKRGNCCHYILIKGSKGWLNKLFWFWSTEINGFFLREKITHKDTGEVFLVMGCRYLQKNGSCAHYHTRPMVCRTWPIIEHFGKPQLLKGCGYKAVLKKNENKLSIMK